jgi:hypothetical protein
MNQARQVVRLVARDAPRDAKVTMAEGKPDRALVVPLNSVSYTGIEEPLKGNAADLYVSVAASVSPHPSVANYLTVELTELKEMAQALADLCHAK